MHMGVHYAGSRVLRSLQVKQHCVNRFMALFQKKRRELAVNDEGFLCRDAWLWPEFAAAHKLTPASPMPTSADAGAIEVAPGALPPAEEVPAGSGLLVAEAASASSEDVSSSASDVTADGHDLCGILPDDTAPEDLPWFVQGKKTHVVKEEVEGRAVPWCRYFPFTQEPQSRGRGCTGTDRSTFCERCLGRMPRGLYLSLAEYNSWML